MGYFFGFILLLLFGGFSHPFVLLKQKKGGGGVLPPSQLHTKNKTASQHRLNHRFVLHARILPPQTPSIIYLPTYGHVSGTGQSTNLGQERSVDNISVHPPYSILDSRFCPCRSSHVVSIPLPPPSSLPKALPPPIPAPDGATCVLQTVGGVGYAVMIGIKNKATPRCPRCA